MSLARFIVLKSNANNKYLYHGKEKGTTHAFLRFSHEMKQHQKGAEFLESEKKNDESLTSEKTEFHFLKFEVEEAKTAKGFVHIRTCYNNKYWVRKSADTMSIVAEAHEPEEDQSKWSCTLFKPIFLGDAHADDDDETNIFVPPHATKPQKIQLIHASELRQHYLVGSGNTTALEVRNIINPAEPVTLDSAAAVHVTFTAFNVEPTVILPTEFTFMGKDGKYMAAYGGDNLGFTTTDVGTPGVAMSTYQADRPDYMPLLIQEPYRKWRLNPYNDVGLVDSRGYPSYFGPIKVGNYVVLHCKENNNFVSRTSDDGVSCRISTITEGSKLRIGEPVTLREVLSADYNLEDARIYNTSSVEKYVDSVSNNTSHDQTTTFEGEYKTSSTLSWNQSVEVHVGVSASWSVGIPKVGEFGLQISYDRTETCQWGEQKTEEKTIKITRNVTIPPRKKVTLKVIAMKSFCDVPFTCKVRDVMTNGRVKEYTKTDGLFVGSNEFDFKTVIDEDDL